MSVSFIDAIVRFEKTGYNFVSNTYLLQLHDELRYTGSIKGAKN
jgi:hypothetical protein